MKIKQGDIFLLDTQIFVVERTIDRFVYLMVIEKDGSVIHGIDFLMATIERYFIKLII